MLNVLRNYIRQETIEPIRSLFGSVIFLFIGSLAVSIGFIFISIGLVAFLQEIDGMDTWFSWVPYLCGSLPKNSMCLKCCHYKSKGVPKKCLMFGHIIGTFW
mgnify:CR=1 FL=1